MERLRGGQYCSAECKTEAKQEEDLLAVESLTLFGQRIGVAPETVKEKPKAPRQKPRKGAATRDPAWGELIPQPAPPLADSAMWIPYGGENPDTADGFRFGFRAMLAAPATAWPMRSRGLPAPGLCAPDPPQWRNATPHFAGQQSEWIAVSEMLPRLAVLLEAPDLSQLLERAEEEPSAPLKRPRVDAHRIASSFPAMMQAGLLRVEPGFAAAVLELRPIAVAIPKRPDPRPARIAGKTVFPACSAELCASVRQGTLGGLEPTCSALAYAVRLVDPADEPPPVEARIPLLGIRTMAATRTRPDIRLPLRYLPMPHFHLPGPAADWSQPRPCNPQR